MIEGLVCPRCGFAITGHEVAAPDHCPRCIAARRVAIRLQRRLPRPLVLTLYIANRCEDELLALERVERELENAEVGAPDGGGFAAVRITALSEAAARELVLAAIERADAEDLVELE